MDISLFLPRHRSCRSFKSFELFFRGAKFAEPFTEILQSIYFRLTLEDLTLQACRVSRPCFKNQMVVCTICMCVYIYYIIHTHVFYLSLSLPSSLSLWLSMPGIFIFHLYLSFLLYVYYNSLFRRYLYLNLHLYLRVKLQQRLHACAQVEKQGQMDAWMRACKCIPALRSQSLLACRPTFVPM